MKITIRPKFPMFSEMVRGIGIQDYSLGDPRRMDEMIKVIERIKPRPWWKRLQISWRKERG